MLNNVMELNINTLEIQLVIENWFNTNENNKDETVFESETFEFNEVDIRYKSDSDSDFSKFESENEESKNNEESDIIIEQKKTKNLTSCINW